MSNKRNGETMNAITVASMTVEVNSTRIVGQIERDGEGFAISIDGNHVGSTRKLNSAIRQMVADIRRRLPHGRPGTWGVVIHCATSSFSFTYGRLRESGQSAPRFQFSPCVQRFIDRYPSPDQGLGPALAHAEAALADCCR